MENSASCNTDDYKPLLSVFVIISNNQLHDKTFDGSGWMLKNSGPHYNLMDSINRDHDILSYLDYSYDQKYWHLIVSKRSSSKRNTEDNYYIVDGVYALAPILLPPSKKVTVR